MQYEPQDKQHYEATKQVFRHTALATKGYYDSQPGGRLRHSWWQRCVRKIVLSLLDERFRRDPNMRHIIDVGCGRGDFSIELATRYSLLTEVWGSDFSREALAIACANAKPFTNVFFKEADILAMPFVDKRFDTTVCINVLHHIHAQDLKKALAELARITGHYVILEIKNGRNAYYRHIHSRKVDPVGSIRVFPTSITQVNEFLQREGFRLTAERAIFVIKCLSPLLILMFEREK